MEQNYETAEDRLPVKNSTRVRLANWCGKMKTYDTGINELLDFWEEGHRKAIDETKEGGDHSER